MGKFLRLTESELRSVLREAVMIVLREGAYDKYSKDLVDIDMDSVQDDMDMARAYSQMNDPMIKNVKGSTLRDVLSQNGTDIDDSEGNYEDYSQDFITREYLNTPNAANNYRVFPRYSRKNGGVKNYDNLSGGSDKINAYKQRKGA